MLRRIASNPALRRAAGSNSLRPPVPHVHAATLPSASPLAALPARPFVSAVLLTRETYDDKRVQDLKTELKQRGLTTSGKRTDLIQRLKENDENSVKVFPAEQAGKSSASTVKAPSRRAKSTSAKSRAKSTSSQSAAASTSTNIKPEPSENLVGTPEGASIPHPPNMEPGQVSSMTGEVEQISTMEADTNPPGVPPAKQAQAPIVFNVKIPYEEPVPEQGINVPLMTSYFHPEAKTFSGYSEADGPVAHVPKVRTVSGEDTYHGGGVSHHHPVFEDEHIIGGPVQDQTAKASLDEYSLGSAFRSVLSTMKNDLGFSSETTKKAETAGVRAAETAGRAVESTKSVLRDARDQLSSAIRSGGSGSNSSGKPYSTSSASYSNTSHERAVNDEERRGLYVLGGIVAGGFLLGSFGNQSKKRQEKVKQDIAYYAERTRQDAKEGMVHDVELASLVASAEMALRQPL